MYLYSTARIITSFLHNTGPFTIMEKRERERERVVLQARREGKRGAGEKRRKNFGGGAKGVNKKQWR